MTPADLCFLVFTLVPGLLWATNRIRQSDSVSLPILGHKKTVASVLGALCMLSLSGISCSGVTRCPVLRTFRQAYVESIWQGMEGSAHDHVS